jgi:hypothetical protein
MKRAVLILLIFIGLAPIATADVWKWVDSAGDTHFVDTNRPIYTWVDEYGKVFYSDKPDHEDAISVQLVWVSSRSLDDVQNDKQRSDGGYTRPDETAEERAEREETEKYYCDRATEVYDSYVNAPQLYRTNEAGEREFLSKDETTKTIADTKSNITEFCR